MTRPIMVLHLIWIMMAAAYFGLALPSDAARSDSTGYPDPAAVKRLDHFAGEASRRDRQSGPGTRFGEGAATGRESPDRTRHLAKGDLRDLPAELADTLYLYGNQAYDYDTCWQPYGDHAMRGGGGCFIYYAFDLKTTCLVDGSLEIGVEFASWSESLAVLGPDLWAWNYTSGEWIEIATSMGNQDEMVWRWFTLGSPSDQWVGSDGSLTICVEAGLDDDVVVDEVGTALDGIYPDLTVSRLWVEQPEFCGGDLVDVGLVVKNIGSCQAMAVFVCDVWLDTDWLGFVLVDGLPSADSVIAILHGIVWPQDSDPHALYAVADTDGDVKESDETNNPRQESDSAKPTPPAPSDVQATDGDYPDRVKITWHSTVGATGYAIHREDSLLIADWPDTSYLDFGAGPGEVHIYNVYACNECGCSPEHGSDSGYIGAAAVSIPLIIGWNWFSLNVEACDMSLDSVLASVGADASYIKDQTSYAEYVPAWNGWFGTLQHLTCESTYLIRTSKASALDYTGHYYQCSTPIPLSPGWNWISYLPAAPLSLDDALVSLEDHGIYIKNQVSYAEYVPAWNGWFGTLTSMEPGDGHKIRMATSDTLVYPEQALVAANAGTRQRVTRLGHPGMMDWSITPSAYEYSGSVTATVTWGGQATASPGDVLAAFVDAECRGLQSAVGAPSGEYVFYLMVYSNVAHGETMSFKYFDGKAGTIDDVVPTLDFSENMTCGRAESPFQVHPATGHHPGEKAVRLETALHRIRPNPFHSGTTVSFSIKQAGHVTVQISDVRGERIKVLVDEVLVPGTYSVWWDRRNQSGQPVASGFYFCRMKTEGYTSVKKMTVLQ